MSSEKLVWTTDMKNNLLRFWSAGMDYSEIADRLGIKLEQVESAITRARRGVWGNDFGAKFRKATPESTLDDSCAEADERGITYGELQTERRLAAISAPDPAEDSHIKDQPVDIHICEPIDMLKAINDLVTCSITQNSRVTAVSAVEGQFADIAFVRGDQMYVLSLRAEE